MTCHFPSWHILPSHAPRPLNVVVDYTADGSSFYGKLHLGTCYVSAAGRRNWIIQGL
ncbi:hypothetical protein BQ8794_130251 [Mesorhizobium prunaredense]|uniref:Uncharacterized protein n=1 Tax=Mesorhizobium prunaredense TaxID=1631249 RepID=A0A1R3V3H3_9HYPH|nr:hypothetical protein BQ8794_130251 [Mesorhizobium prunaredense]